MSYDRMRLYDAGRLHDTDLLGWFHSKLLQCLAGVLPLFRRSSQAGTADASAKAQPAPDHGGQGSDALVALAGGGGRAPKARLRSRSAVSSGSAGPRPTAAVSAGFQSSSCG